MLPHVIMHMQYKLWTAKSEVCVPLAPCINLYETRSLVAFEPRICNLDSYVSSIRPLFFQHYHYCYHCFIILIIITAITITTITETCLQVPAILWQLFQIPFFRVWVSDVCSVYACHI